jgi:hypothetical protein
LYPVKIGIAEAYGNSIFYFLFASFFSFSWCIALAKNSSTLLKKTEDSKHPFLIPYCEEYGFIFFPI